MYSIKFDQTSFRQESQNTFRLGLKHTGAPVGGQIQLTDLNGELIQQALVTKIEIRRMSEFIEDPNLRYFYGLHNRGDSNSFASLVEHLEKCYGEIPASRWMTIIWFEPGKTIDD